jgi:beta-lactamase regulating signal transducer with metallopeptidase domain
VLQLLLNHLWQSTLFAAFMGFLTWLLRSHGAHLRFGLWLAASLKFLLPFSLLIALGAQFSWHSGAASQIAPVLIRVAAPFPTDLSDPAPVRAGEIAPHEPARATDAAAPMRNLKPNLASIVLTVWASGSLLVLGFWSVRWSRIRRMAARSIPASIAAPIPVRSSSETLEPGLFGIVRPILLLPAGIEQRLSAQELDAIVRHELEHARRHDNLIAALHMLVEALFWFYPLVWWLGRRLLIERENACDESVIAGGCDRETYAQSILTVCKHYLQLPLPCSAGVAGADLKRRIEDIMRRPPLRSLGAAGTALLSAAVLAALITPIALGAFLASTTAQAGTGAETGAQTVPAADEPTPEQARLKADIAASRGLLRQGQYAELERRMSGFQSSYEAGTLGDLDLLHEFSAFALTDPALKDSFDDWIAAYPKSYVARLARGMYYFDSGVQTRGKRYMSHTTAEQVRGMRLYLAESSADLQASLALDAKPMISYNLLIRINLELGDRDAKQARLESALRLDPIAMAARRPYMISLETRWGGSLNEMLSFLQASQQAGLSAEQLAMLQQLVDKEREWLQKHSNADEAVAEQTG